MLYNTNQKSCKKRLQSSKQDQFHYSVTNLQFLSGDTSRGRIRNRNGSFACLHQLVFPEHHHCIIQVVDLLVEVTFTEVGDACHSHWGEPQGMEDTSPHGSHSLLPSHLSLL